MLSFALILLADSFSPPFAYVSRLSMCTWHGTQRRDRARPTASIIYSDSLCGWRIRLPLGLLFFFYDLSGSNKDLPKAMASLKLIYTDLRPTHQMIINKKFIIILIV